jgi:hypothetical protein
VIGTYTSSRSISNGARDGQSHAVEPSVVL